MGMNYCIYYTSVIHLVNLEKSELLYSRRILRFRTSIPHEEVDILNKEREIGYRMLAV